MVAELSASEWDKRISNSERPAVVDFWRNDCVWCQKLEPIYQELASEIDGADFLTFDISDGLDNMRLAQRLGIIGTPTIKIFCGGAETGELIGFAEKATLRNDIADVIENNKNCVKNYGQYSDIPENEREVG